MLYNDEGVIVVRAVAQQRAGAGLRVARGQLDRGPAEPQPHRLRQLGQVPQRPGRLQQLPVQQRRIRLLHDAGGEPAGGRAAEYGSVRAARLPPADRLQRLRAARAAEPQPGLPERLQLHLHALRGPQVLRPARGAAAVRLVQLPGHRAADDAGAAGRAGVDRGEGDAERERGGEGAAVLQHLRQPAQDREHSQAGRQRQPAVPERGAGAVDLLDCVRARRLVPLHEHQELDGDAGHPDHAGSGDDRAGGLLRSGHVLLDRGLPDHDGDAGAAEEGEELRGVLLRGGAAPLHPHLAHLHGRHPHVLEGRALPRQRAHLERLLQHQLLLQRRRRPLEHVLHRQLRGPRPQRHGLLLRMGMVLGRRLPALPHHALLPLRLHQEQEARLAAHFPALPRLRPHGFHPDHGQRLALPHPQPQLPAAAALHGQVLLQALDPRLCLHDGRLLRAYLLRVEERRRHRHQVCEQGQEQRAPAHALLPRRHLPLRVHHLDHRALPDWRALVDHGAGLLQLAQSRLLHPRDVPVRVRSDVRLQERPHAAHPGPLVLLATGQGLLLHLPHALHRHHERHLLGAHGPLLAVLLGALPGHRRHLLERPAGHLPQLPHRSAHPRSRTHLPTPAQEGQEGAAPGQGGQLVAAPHRLAGPVGARDPGEAGCGEGGRAAAVMIRIDSRLLVMEQDIIIKFCVVGEPSVGKTSMLYQYVHHKFDEKVRPTIGCDFSTKLKSSLDDKAVRLQLWDIAGQERFNSVSKMYLRGALGCVIVCSAVDIPTVHESLKWKKIIEENTDMGLEGKIPCLLVQNKSDLINNEKPENHQTKKFLEEFARSNDFCGFLQCSAKDNRNIEEVFQQLLDETIRRGFVKNSPIRSESKKAQQGSNIVLNNAQAATDKRNRGGCC